MGRRAKGYQCRDGTWRVQLGSKRYRRRTRAEILELVAAAERAEHQPTSDAPRTVTGLVRHWIAWKAQIAGRFPAHADEMLAELVDTHGSDALASIDRDFLTGYLGELRTRPSRCRYGSAHRLGAETIRKKVRYASSVLSWGHGRGWVPIRPDVPALPAPPFAGRAYSQAELAALLASLAASPRCKRFLPLIRFILETGVRPGEARQTQWRGIDLERGVMLVPAHKTAPRIVPLSPTAAEIIRQLSHQHPRWVFVSYRGQPYSQQGLSSILKRRGFSIYRLRHTWCQRAADKGVPQRIIEEWMGHVDSQMIRHYVRVAETALHAAAAATDGLSLVPPPVQVRPAKGAKPRIRRRTSPDSPQPHSPGTAMGDVSAPRQNTAG